MGRPLWLVKIIEILFPFIKKIAKFTHIPLLKSFFKKALFEGDNIIYLPKDTSISIGQNVEIPQNLVLPSEIVKYFIKQTDFHWKMNFCICRDAMQCKDYPIDYGCLFLGRAILDINPKLGKRIKKEDALKYVEECREKGLVHLIGKNRLDAQWLGVKNGNQLLSICNCCPCCCLWRISPVLHSSIGQKIKKMPGVKVKVNQNKCVGCGICIDICFVDAIRVSEGKANISAECRGCGRCVEVCPSEAITLTLSNPDYYDSTINEMKNIIDLD